MGSPAWLTNVTPPDGEILLGGVAADLKLIGGIIPAHRASRITPPAAMRS